MINSYAKKFVYNIIEIYICIRYILYHAEGLTTGVNAQLVTDTDGVTLIGIRVLWTVKSQYISCQYRYLRAHLFTDPNVHRLKSIILAHGTSSHVFNNGDLLCNEHYRTRITYSLGITGVGDQNFQLRLFYGSRCT